MSELRYAIIGSGMMGQEHIRNIHLLDNARVSAVADPDEGMRLQAKELAGTDTVAFEDYRDLMNADIADVLVIASPNHTHLQVMLDVMPSNLPILVEKPLCTVDQDCQTLLAEAEKRSAPIWVAMEYRYMPPVQEFLSEIDQGNIGTLKTFSILEHRFPFLEKVGDWNRFNIKTGGTLVEKCCHFFDLMRLISQAKPVKVYASGGVDVNHLDERYEGKQPDILDNAMVIVDFDNGIRGYLELNMFAEGSRYQEHITAIGDEAKVEIRIPGPTRFSPNGIEHHADITLSPRATKAPQRRNILVDETILLAGDHHGSTFYQHQKFNQIVREGGEPEVSLEDGAIAVQIGAAAEESVRTGMPVHL